MTTSAIFQQVKDPADVAWYAITFVGVTLTDATPTVEIEADGALAAQNSFASYPTPGDALPGAPLTAANPQVVHAPSGDGVALLLSGGVPGQTYAVRVGVVATDGSTLFRSAILIVAGL